MSSADEDRNGKPLAAHGIHGCGPGQVKVSEAPPCRPAPDPASSEGPAGVPVQSQVDTANGTTAHPPPPPPSSASTTSTQKMVSTGPQNAPVPAVAGVQRPCAPAVRAMGPPQPCPQQQPMIRMAAAGQASGRTVVIIPTPAAPQPVPVTLRPPQAPSVKLPTNFQIPSGMVLVRSDNGQLMLVSQQALAQAQVRQAQVQNPPSGPRPRTPSLQVSAAAIKKADYAPVIRIAAPPSVKADTVQKTTVIKVMGAPTPRTPAVKAPQVAVHPVAQTSPPPSGTAEATAPKGPALTVTRETLDNVKKCKNFLVTLMKLASSGAQSASLAANIRELVRKLLDGRIEPEEFTEQLYRELKSSPQPFLVPFLKKSLPAVRKFIPSPQVFIQEVDEAKPQPSSSKAPASTSGCTPSFVSANVKHSALNTGSSSQTAKPPQVPLQPKAVVVRPGMMAPYKTQSHTSVPTTGNSARKHIVLQSGQHTTGSFIFKRPVAQASGPSSKHVYQASSASYREEDDINDVASMAGVNLKEENARILASGSAAVGSVLRACQEEPFLPHGPLLARILLRGKAVGLLDVNPEVVHLVSQATIERLRGLLEKVTKMAEHRKPIALKLDQQHVQVSDVRGQLRFLEEVERLKKQRRDDEKKERLLHIARSRSHSNHADQQEAKELQQQENAQLQQRQTNLTALAAIGPRKKRSPDGAGNQVPALTRVGVQRVTRVTMKDLLVCMEQDRNLRHSLILYKALLN